MVLDEIDESPAVKETPVPMNGDGVTNHLTMPREPAFTRNSIF